MGKIPVVMGKPRLPVHLNFTVTVVGYEYNRFTVKFKWIVMSINRGYKWVTIYLFILYMYN